MEVTSFLCILVTIVVGYIWWDLNRKKNFPPGPFNVSLNQCKLYLEQPNELLKVCEKYGGICTFPVYSRIIVILTNWEGMKESFAANNAFEDRPNLFFYINKDLDNKDMFSGTGPAYKEKRRFVLHHLRNLGFGKSSMETVITREISQLIAILDKSDGQEVEISKLFTLSVLNVLWGIIAGKSFDYEDETTKQFLRFVSEKLITSAKSFPVTFVPFLRFLPGDPFHFWKTTERGLTEYKFYDREVQEHVNSFQLDNLRDFIDIYLANIFKQSETDKLRETCFDMLHLKGTLFTLFNAGQDTTSTTLEWAMLYFVTWPEIQQKIQTELDIVIGRHRKPTVQDRPLLPYTEATIMEIQRFSTMISIITHRALKDTQIMGYTIPKGTTVIRSIFAVHHDKSLWGDPEVFRPERFINEDGKVFKPEYFIPFSNGPRQCIAQQMVRIQLFLFVATLLQNFNFSYGTGKKPPNLESKYYVVKKTEKYSIIVKRRLN